MRPRLFLLGTLGLVAALSSACGSGPTPRATADLPAAPAPSPSEEVGRWVGDLLSSNAVASVAAEGALLNLDDAHRAALAVNARRIPTERDPRWRNVLYQNGLLPNVTPDERLDLLVWAASRPSQVDVVKAQNELLDMAAKDPDLLLARLARTGPGRDVIAVALSFAHERRAVPALVDLYRGPSSPVERRAAAAALARLAGNDLAPRPDASDDERAKDAARLSAWYREKGGAADATR